MNIMFSGMPNELTTIILYSLDFESKSRCEAVCKLWHQCLYDINDYQEKKEEYFAHKIYPLLDTFPDNLINIFGKRKIVCMPKFDVDFVGSYPEVREEITNFLLRHDYLFCRGEDSSGRQYVAVSYHLWDSEKELPKSFHNDALIYYEKEEYSNPALKNSDHYKDRKYFWDASKENIDLLQLLEKGTTSGPYGDFGSPFTLGSNKKNLQRISNISALFYEMEILWDCVCMNIRHTVFGRRYTTYS